MSWFHILVLKKYGFNKDIAQKIATMVNEYHLREAISCATPIICNHCGVLADDARYKGWFYASPHNVMFTFWCMECLRKDIPSYRFTQDGKVIKKS